MNIQQSTHEFETWLGKAIPLVPEDLAYKHTQMALGLFPFFRATYYRWIQLWPEICGKLAETPEVLAVGDLHIENFGTWRDAEGRLAWGVNDFDEAAKLPYAVDLVRLAASALLAARGEHLAIGDDDVCDAILKGYSDSLKAGGAPLVLAERHAWLRALALDRLRDPVLFWQTLKESPNSTAEVPGDAARGIEDMLPKRDLPYRVVRRMKGLGSLGRQRFIALAEWHGGMIAREAKALAPPASAWATGSGHRSPVHFAEILAGAVRCHDPFLNVGTHWILRRIAPDCARVELSSLSKATAESRILRAMGWETANVHLGTADAVKPIRRDLRRRPRRWLLASARKMLRALVADWDEWRVGAGRGSDRQHGPS